jgi:hypothetical protein
MVKEYLLLKVQLITPAINPDQLNKKKSWKTTWKYGKILIYHMI